MKASIIIPVYNSEAFLGDCLKSALGQSVEDIEVICVDDGSTDSSKDIIRDFSKADSRLKMLEQENKGGGAARNTGLASAQGDFLYFMDSDDWAEPNLLETAIEVMERFDADIALFPAYTVDDRTGEKWDTDWVFRVSAIPDKRPFCYLDMPDYIFNTFGNVPWNKVFRRSFVMDQGIRFQEIYRTNDMLFVCRALIEAKRMVTVDEHLAYYRVGTLTNCQSTNEREPLGFYKAFREMKRYLQGQGIYESVKRSFLNHALDAVVSNLYTIKDPDAFCHLVCKCRNEISLELDLDSEEASYYRDPVKYQLYRAICDSNERDAVFSWARALQSQRDEAWEMSRMTIEQKNGEIASLQSRLVELDRLLSEAQGELNCLEASITYKITRAIVFPFRTLHRLMDSSGKQENENR